ncbi:MAG: hypothetical protein V9F82_00635 [Dermatophilaceae bacterium]
MRRAQLGAGVLVLAALAFGRFVSEALPGNEVSNDPISRPATIGEPVHLRAFDVTVSQVRGAKEIVAGTTPLATPGIWVVADLVVVPRSEALRPGYAAVRAADGRLWETAGSRSRVDCPGAIAGVVSRCTAYLDVARDGLADAELLIGWHPDDRRFDDLAVLPLAVSDAQLQAWEAATEPLEIPQGTVGS